MVNSFGVNYNVELCAIVSEHNDNLLSKDGALKCAGQVRKSGSLGKLVKQIRLKFGYR